jgi:hypothetical protein
MKTLGNAEQVSKGLGILSIKEIVSKEKKRLLENEKELLIKRLKERI